jgi:hypothetical protein
MKAPAKKKIKHTMFFLKANPRNIPPDKSGTEVTCITIALNLAGEGFSQISECGLHHLVFRAAEGQLLRVGRELTSPALRLWGEGGARRSKDHILEVDVSIRHVLRQ